MTFSPILSSTAAVARIGAVGNRGGRSDAGPKVSEAQSAHAVAAWWDLDYFVAMLFNKKKEPQDHSVARPALTRARDACWSLEVLAQHLSPLELVADLMDRCASRVGSEACSFWKWAACASTRAVPKRSPYIRNIAIPGGWLRQECARLSPFPAGSPPTMFLGCRGSRTQLHADGVLNAILVVHGLKLVVLVPPTAGAPLPAAEVIALNSVLCHACDHSLALSFPRAVCRRAVTRWASLAKQPFAGPIGNFTVGSLSLQYSWLEPGNMLTLPQGWLHFVHNEESTVSVSFWGSAPKPDTELAAKPDTDLAAKPATDLAWVPPPEDSPHPRRFGGSGSSCVLPTAASDLPTAATVLPTAASLVASLPLVLLEAVAIQCFCGRPHPHDVRAVCRAANCCSFLRDACMADVVWCHGFKLQWGVDVFDRVVNAGEDGREDEFWGGSDRVPGIQRWWQRFSRVHVLVGSACRTRPKEAVRAWQEAGLIPPGPDHFDGQPFSGGDLSYGDPAALATFLHAHHSRLDRVWLGEFLSHVSALPVFHAWMARLGPSLQGLSMEATLRLFLMLFALPGEAPKIDRLMERLARTYLEHNPTEVYTSDDVYILFFSIIMLSTDLHNPHIPESRRMTGAQFANNFYRVDAGEGAEHAFSIPASIIAAIYESIHQTPIGRMS
mmetsp:Transcript_26410/g.43901  ORF Transcript_26410/g.43901 Transcript_26410/m.43901 type:complete len:668 (-) Transcript_26410:134-2137(-)